MVLLVFPIWWLFTLPGRLTLWVHYYFPNNIDNVFAYERQMKSKVIMLYYATKFWFQALMLLLLGPGCAWWAVSFLMSSYVSQLQPFPPALLHMYHVLNSYSMVLVSAQLDKEICTSVYHCGLWVLTQINTLCK